MRVCLFLLVTCLVLLVLVEGRSSNDSKSKSSESKSSRHEGRVTKVRSKPIRHHSSESSESSEENRHKHKRKHSERFMSEERFDSRKGNRTRHKIRSKHNSTREYGVGFNNRTGNDLAIRNNTTSHESLKINTTQSTGQNLNQTLIGWKIFVKPNMNKTNSVNETRHVVTNFLHNEMSVKFDNGSQLHSNKSVWNNNMTPPPYGWKNLNSTGTQQGWKNVDTSDPAHGWKNFSATDPSEGWKNINAANPSQGWKNFNATDPAYGRKNTNVTDPSQGWKNINAPDHSQGWKNINATAPLQGWQYSQESAQGWNIAPSAPDYRKEFSVPDHINDQNYYFGSPAIGGHYQKNQNSISVDNKPFPNPVIPENRKIISNIAPEHGWGAQPSYTNYDHFNSGGAIFNSYPIQNNYGSSEESSSKLAKGAKKMFKKLSKGAGNVLSSDQLKDAMKQAASSYFANPPPQGWIYQPPLDNTRQIFYGRFSKPAGKESFSADDWRSIIFGNVPRKAETRNLYSAAFPETFQNMDLNVFSDKGRLPDFNQKQYKSFFPRPYYPKLFAGLQNEDINENFRAKRELSEKGKKMADAINKFFLHERDCNDTELDARRKRHLTIRPIPKNTLSEYKEEKRITDFPFLGVEAIVQSDHSVSIYEEEPKEIKTDNNSTEKNPLKGEDSNININGVKEKILSTSELPVSNSRNRTKLFPVSETIEQFLNKKPITRLSVVDESLEKWKSKARETVTFVTQRSDEMEATVQTNRIVRRHQITNEPDSERLYHWISDPIPSYSAEVRPYDSEIYRENMEESESSTETQLNDDEAKTYTLDTNVQTPNPVLNSNEDTSPDEEITPRTSNDSEETLGNDGFYFFGVYINNYNAQKWENHVSSGESYDLGTEEIEFTTPSYKTFTDDNHLQAALMESTIETPTLTYPDHDESSTEKIPDIPKPTIPDPKSDSYIIPKTLGNLFYFPFKIHSISSISYADYTKKMRRSTQKYTNDMETPVTGPSIIRAPLITNRCRKNERMVKGKCRAIW